ncbi:uncharacterized protein EI97DRAFT_196924 [Westerdykella ornata]|uniref:HIT-type domain-containing protein n=1 Tax=Westerdykella ornata TaxID=318751 RepID=A0A6A6J8Z0_WESOR|nr:uncharacterized protein EI97DRAFT_196924 [Westerdykella ornata]KAF2272815.1 hypothetical protein EI97DRAFT_196924 [Westerdykella ornata]
MAEQLCRVCNAQPRKYKCPTCSLPYCSLACFKLHKEKHLGEDAASSNTTHTPTAHEVHIPEPPAPPPVPRYIKQQIDYSALGTNPKFRELLQTHTTLLPLLQRIYAATIEPDRDDQIPAHNTWRSGRGRGQTRGDGNRGRGRGRGRGSSYTAFNPPKWTPKRGDAHGLRLLKRYRDGQGTAEEKEAIDAFVSFVEESLLGEQEVGAT